jgi:alkaline phosphatase
MRSKSTRAALAAACLLAGAGAVVSPATAPAQTGAPGEPGNVVFLHPDGSGPNHWQAARSYWYGPDAVMPWDRMPELAVYRGHMADQLVGTSNGGATVHAFGFKVNGPGSFGTDVSGSGAAQETRLIDSLSGYPGSIMREAGNARHPIGVVNDGTLPEPGTGAFLAEVGNRNDFEAIALQMLEGRPGEDDRRAHVLLGGGERHFLPAGEQGVHGPGTRTDGRDLVEEAEDAGYVVVRTREEFEDLEDRLRRRPNYAPRVLGLFASFHTFNDRNEEQLVADGLVDPSIDAADKRSNLILFGSKPGTPGYDPPTVAEMNRLALEVLDRQAERRGRPFLLVSEPESVDNFGNTNNAIGTLTALRRSNDAIEEIRRYTERGDTTVLTAADSDASGLQLINQRRADDGGLANVGFAPVNPAFGLPAVGNPVDGLTGRGTRSFEAEPDQFGQRLPFGILWVSENDVQGGIVSRAEGQSAELLRTQFRERFDNVDVYRFLYRSLFGEQLPYPQGRRAPTRG